MNPECKPYLSCSFLSPVVRSAFFSDSAAVAATLQSCLRCQQLALTANSAVSPLHRHDIAEPIFQPPGHSDHCEWSLWSPQTGTPKPPLLPARFYPDIPGFAADVLQETYPPAFSVFRISARN